MNQEKTGKFIAELRKEKNMTQIDLADKLGITDRAVSKWENGRGMPDLSLLAPLCEILGVSINELLSGERLDKKDYQEKLEDNIINTINYTDKKINKTKRVLIAALSVILILTAATAAIVTMYVIDVTRMQNNKPVVFGTWGYPYTSPVDLREGEIESAITDYLVEKGDDEQKHYENEKTFAGMKIYQVEEKDGFYNVYAWVLNGKYYLENDEIKQDSGSSAPYKFVVEYADGKYTVTDFFTPRDGGNYSVDIKNIFPAGVRNDINDVHTDGTIEKLQLNIDRQTKLYFHK